MSTDQSQISIADLIARFGGIPALADKLGVPASTVQTWALRNSVPTDQIETIRAAAAEHGVDLTASAPTVAPPPPPPPPPPPTVTAPPAEAPKPAAPPAPPGPVSSPVPDSTSALAQDGSPPWHARSAGRPGPADPLQAPPWHARSAGRPGPGDPFQAPSWHEHAPKGGASRPQQPDQSPQAPAAQPPVTASEPVVETENKLAAAAVATMEATPEPTRHISLLARIRAALNDRSAGARPITMITVFIGLAVAASIFWAIVIGVYDDAPDDAAVAAATAPPARRQRTPATTSPAPAAADVAQTATEPDTITPANDTASGAVDSTTTGESSSQDLPTDQDASAAAGPADVPAEETDGDVVEPIVVEPIVAGVEGQSATATAGAGAEVVQDGDGSAGVSETEIGVPSPATETAAGTVAGTVAGTATAATSVPQVSLAAITEARFGELTANMAALQSAQDADAGALAEIGPRLDALEASLSGEMALMSRALGVSLTAGRIRGALASGTDYSGEMARLTALIGSEGDFTALIEALQAGAGGELLSDAQARMGWQGFSSDIEDAARLSSATGFFGRLWARLATLVSVRRASDEAAVIVDAADRSPRALMRRAQSQLDAGNLDAALESIDQGVEGIEAGDLPAGYSAWREAAGLRAQADRAAAELEGVSLDNLARLAAQ